MKGRRLQLYFVCINVLVLVGVHCNEWKETTAILCLYQRPIACWGTVYVMKGRRLQLYFACTNFLVLVQCNEGKETTGLFCLYQCPSGSGNPLQTL